MQVLCDKKGYILSYALIGNLVDGEEITVPEEFDHFCEHFQSYRVKGKKLEYDEKQDAALLDEKELNKLRSKREKECFSVINRGQLWYEQLTAEQSAELRNWYQAWLDATNTRVVPNKPAWL